MTQTESKVSRECEIRTTSGDDFRVILPEDKIKTINHALIHKHEWLWFEDAGREVQLRVSCVESFKVSTIASPVDLSRKFF